MDDYPAIWYRIIGSDRPPRDPDRQGSQQHRRVNPGWLRVGPWVLGSVRRWERSDRP